MIRVAVSLAVLCCGLAVGITVAACRVLAGLPDWDEDSQS